MEETKKKKEEMKDKKYTFIDQIGENTTNKVILLTYFKQQDEKDIDDDFWQKIFLKKTKII